MTDDSRTVVLARASSEWQASLLVEVLRERGIDAEVSGALTSQFRAEAPGYARVIVPSDQLEAAEAALAAHRQAVSEIDWSQVDLGEAPS
jgi:hypothetical protein